MLSRRDGHEPLAQALSCLVRARVIGLQHLCVGEQGVDDVGSEVLPQQTADSTRAASLPETADPSALGIAVPSGPTPTGTRWCPKVA